MNLSSETISEFRVRHQAIADILDQCQVLSRSYLQAKPKICEMRERLLAHFAYQNDEFFGKLSVVYADDKQAMKMLEFLVCDLKDIRIKYLIFFEKHSGEMGDVSGKAFPSDLIEFVRDVMMRVKIEEEYLLPLLEKALN